MQCCFYLCNERDKMADGKTAMEKRYGKTNDGRNIDWLSTSQLRGWSGDMMIADYVKICKSQKEASGIYVKRFKNQDIFVKEDYEFPCANGTLRVPSRPRPSSTVEGNFDEENDVEIEEGDKKGRKT